ncbi:hypothetical protein Q668_13490 [Alcanivorax sp. PN-3]|nr:hypothetical protein Q668_13490 [Alcanivorax sp. PN-3]
MYRSAIAFSIFTPFFIQLYIKLNLSIFLFGSSHTFPPLHFFYAFLFIIIFSLRIDTFIFFFQNTLSTLQKKCIIRNGKLTKKVPESNLLSTLLENFIFYLRNINSSQS